MADRPDRTLLSKTLTELLGNFCLVCVAEICLSMQLSHTPEAIASILIAIIYMGFDLSGAHYNPAVTLTFVLRGRCTPTVALWYLCAQLLGGYMGAMCALFMCGKTGEEGGVLRIGDGYTLAQALLAETVFTTLLCACILMVALRRGVPLISPFGFAIVAVVYTGMICVGGISGAAFNAAVIIPLSLAAGGRNLDYAIVVSGVTLASAIVATAVFYAVAPEELAAIRVPGQPTSNITTPDEETALLSPRSSN